MSILAKILRGLPNEDLLSIVRAAPDEIVCGVIRAANDAALRPLFNIIPTLDEKEPAPAPAQPSEREALVDPVTAILQREAAATSVAEAEEAAEEEEEEKPQEAPVARGLTAAASVHGFTKVVLEALTRSDREMTTHALARSLGEQTVRVKNALSRLRATGHVVSTDSGYVLAGTGDRQPADDAPEPAAEDARGPRPTGARLLEDIVTTLRKQGPTTNYELAAAMDLPPSSLSVALAQLALQGRVRRTKRSRTVVNEAL